MRTASATSDGCASIRTATGRGAASTVTSRPPWDPRQAGHVCPRHDEQVHAVVGGLGVGCGIRGDHQLGRRQDGDAVVELRHRVVEIARSHQHGLAASGPDVGRVQHGHPFVGHRPGVAPGCLRHGRHDRLEGPAEGEEQPSQLRLSDGVVADDDGLLRADDLEAPVEQDAAVEHGDDVGERDHRPDPGAGGIVDPDGDPVPADRHDLGWRDHPGRAIDRDAPCGARDHEDLIQRKLAEHRPERGDGPGRDLGEAGGPVGESFEAAGGEHLEVVLGRRQFPGLRRIERLAVGGPDDPDPRLAGRRSRLGWNGHRHHVDLPAHAAGPRLPYAPWLSTAAAVTPLRQRIGAGGTTRSGQTTRR